MREECKNLKGRMKDICNGDADLPLHVINKYRKFWGLEPFSGALFKKEKDTKNFRAAKKGCSSCNKRRGTAKQAVKFQDALSKYDGITSEQEMQSRLETCAACPLLQGNICNACGCDINDKVKKRTEQCPLMKWFPEIREPKRIENPTKNLMMYILPVIGNDMWKWNIEQISKRMDLFNGKVVLSIGCSGKPFKSKRRAGAVFETEKPDVVLKEFEKYNISLSKVFYHENNEKLGEVVAFRDAMGFLKSLDEKEVTFSCHAKGVTHRGKKGIKEWSETMYHTCLDDWDTIKSALELYSMAGPHRRFGYFATPGNNRWHYSGTFYWFRHDDVFSRNWEKIDKRFFGTESWPGLMFSTEECACVFNDDCGNLYKEDWSDIYELIAEWDLARGIKYE